MYTKHLYRINVILLVLTIAFACKKTEVPDNLIESKRPPHAGFNTNDMVLTWNENLEKIMARSLGNPPTFSRHVTMTQIAVHDALNSIVPKYHEDVL